MTKVQLEVIANIASAQNRSGRILRAMAEEYMREDHDNIDLDSADFRGHLTAEYAARGGLLRQTHGDAGIRDRDLVDAFKHILFVTGI